MPRGKQIKPTKADRQRWMRQLREQADAGDARAIEIMMQADNGDARAIEILRRIAWWANNAGEPNNERR